MHRGCPALLVPLSALLLGAGACGTEPARPPFVCEAPRVRPRVAHAQCGPTLDFTPINAYQGALALAQEREEAVVLINGSCTGTLIAAAAGPVVLTAGHCAALGARVLAAFNVEDAPDGDPLVTEGSVLERADDPDYALVALDRLPQAVPTPLATQVTERLSIIQHPRGRPKVVAEGEYLDTCGAEVVYGDLDTLVGSSGAGVLNARGELIAVHTDGDCAGDNSGTNRGWSAARVVEASAYLEAADLGAR